MKSFKRILATGIGLASNIHPLVRRERKHGLTIFMFHEVTDTPSNFALRYGLSVPVGLFEKQIEWISAVYEPIHPSQLLTGCLPHNAALITFDDGWAGTFKNALPVLERMKIPCIIFLNMDAIENMTPLVPAAISYLEQETGFQNFASNLKLSKPYYLSIAPENLKLYEEKNGREYVANALAEQGELANRETLNQWDGSHLVTYGNHMFNHWNTAILADDEVISEYSKNDSLLKKYKSYTPLFAIPHGQWGSCFGIRESRIVHKLGALKIFAGCGSVNRQVSSLVLDRINTTNAVTSPALLRFSIARYHLALKPSLQHELERVNDGL